MTDHVNDPDERLAGIAGAMAVPGRTRMLNALVDGRARTATELAIVAGVGASTASAHLAHLVERNLVAVDARGRHRYYTLRDKRVAVALEALMVLAADDGMRFEPSTPPELRQARSCYDHLAGAIAVALRERFVDLGWLGRPSGSGDYTLRQAGIRGFESVGVDVEAARAKRRRFAYACLDWSERKPHLGGALGAAFLETALRRRWFERDDDSRRLELTRAGRTELVKKFGLAL